MRNLQTLDYLENVRTVNQLCKAVEALADLLAKKNVATKFEIDCVIEEAVVKADKEFDREVFGIDCEEKEK